MRIEAFTTYMPVGMSFCVEKPQRQTFGHRFVPDHKKSLRLKGVLTKSTTGRKFFSQTSSQSIYKQIWKQESITKNCSREP